MEKLDFILRLRVTLNLTDAAVPLLRPGDQRALHARRAAPLGRRHARDRGGPGAARQRARGRGLGGGGGGRAGVVGGERGLIRSAASLEPLVSVLVAEAWEEAEAAAQASLGASPA